MSKAKIEREKSGKDDLKKEKSGSGLNRKKSLPKIGKIGRQSSRNDENKLASPRRPKTPVPSERVEKLIKNLTLTVQQERVAEETPPLASPKPLSTSETTTDQNSEEEKAYQTVFLKEIQRKRSVVNLFDNAETANEAYSTVVFKGEPEPEPADAYSTVVMKTCAEEEGYGTMVIKCDPAERQQTIRAPRTLKFLDPAYAVTLMDKKEGQPTEKASDEVDERTADDITKAQTTMMEIIVDLQTQLQDLLEKVCIVDSLDILFQMTNLLKNIRAEILKMKRYVNVVNFSMNFTAGREEDRLQQAIDYVEDQICGISTLLDSIQHKLPKVKSHHGVLFLLETALSVQSKVNEVLALPIGV